MRRADSTPSENERVEMASRNFHYADHKYGVHGQTTSAPKRDLPFSFIEHRVSRLCRIYTARPPFRHLSLFFRECAIFIARVSGLVYDRVEGLRLFAVQIFFRNYICTWEIIIWQVQWILESSLAITYVEIRRW